MTFHYFGGLVPGYFGKHSVGDSCLVSRLLLMTFHYFWGLLLEAFRRGQLLSNQIAVDDLSILLGVTLGSLPLRTDA